MTDQNIHLIYFSPTNTTKTVIESIAKGVGAKQVSHLNMANKLPDTLTIENSVAIIGVPVYSGRIPRRTQQELLKIKGNNTYAILVAVYGNRHYDDTLVELNDVVVENGFIPIAAAAFIGEHSYSLPEMPIAEGRPDASDLGKAVEFGREIKKLMQHFDSTQMRIHIPGNRPYKALGGPIDIAPVTDELKCDLCGICVSVCPTQAISINGKLETNVKDCILCCACVKACPNEARYNDSEHIKGVCKRLKELCAERKEPELFFAD
jgi:ferredoxin/flavodoxin